MTPDMLYNALLSFVAAIGWYWVRSIDKKQEEDKQRMDRIEERIRTEYQMRDDARRDNDRLYNELHEIRNQMTRISEKIDQKADKT